MVANWVFSSLTINILGLHQSEFCWLANLLKLQP